MGMEKYFCVTADASKMYATEKRLQIKTENLWVHVVIYICDSPARGKSDGGSWGIQKQIPAVCWCLVVVGKQTERIDDGLADRRGGGQQSAQ